MVRRHISKDVKELALRMSLEQQVPDDCIKQYTTISKRSLRRLRQTFRETGEVIRSPVCAGRPRLLDSLDANFLEACVERQPDMSLSELQLQLAEICNVDVTEKTISMTLKRRGFTRKLLTRPAIERDEDDRAEFRMLIGEHYEAQQLVFTDETHCNRLTLRRSFGWARRGGRARRRDFFIRGKGYSILPAMSLDGILHLHAQDHPITGEDFLEFLEGLLDQMQPWPLPNSVLVMDNASIHKIEGIRETIEARGMRLIYLPAYSPDLNPIEEAFSALKSWLRSNRDYVRGEMDGTDSDPYALIWEAAYAVMSPESAFGWYRHSEYIA